MSRRKLTQKEDKNHLVGLPFTLLIYYFIYEMAFIESALDDPENYDEFLDYTVSNAGNSATISELINGDGQAIISFAHWSFTFTQASLDHFGF